VLVEVLGEYTIPAAKASKEAKFKVHASMGLRNGKPARPCSN
jgi:hypothetical protein